MEQLTDKLPPTQEGDKIGVSFEITKVFNGYIVKNTMPDTPPSTMVFNGDKGHQLATGYVLDLAIVNMKEGEIINFSSQLEYVKKQS